jgi:hypothetical protein
MQPLSIEYVTKVFLDRYIITLHHLNTFKKGKKKINVLFELEKSTLINDEKPIVDLLLPGCLVL